MTDGKEWGFEADDMDGRLERERRRKEELEAERSIQEGAKVGRSSAGGAPAKEIYRDDPGYLPPGRASDKLCNDEHHSGHICTRKLGHGGDCAAHGVADQMVHRWRREVAAVEKTVEPKFWGVNDPEIFSNDDRDEAIQYYLEGCDPWPQTVEAQGAVPLQLGPHDLVARHIVGDILEHLDEEYGNPEDEYTQPTKGMLDAAIALCEAIRRDYTPWSCEVVVRETVDVRKWVEENCPWWLDEADWVAPEWWAEP